MEDPKVLLKSESARLSIGVLLNLTLAIVEYIAGVLTGSLALISTAGNSLADTTALVISFIADKIAQRERDATKTYGYGRANILGALLNALIFIATACFIFYEAWQSFVSPHLISAPLVILVSAIALTVKITIMLLLIKKRENINIRTAFLDSLFDALGLFGSLFAGLVIFFTNFYLIDSIISASIGLLILYNGWSIINQTVNILLEGTPKHLNLEKIVQSIKQIPLVTGVDNVHVWAISSQYCALSCHVCLQTDDLQTAIATIAKIKKMLLEKYNIQHPTIEPEIIKG